VAKYGIGLASNDWQQFLPFVWQNGGELVDAQGKPTLSSPQVVQALSEYAWYFQHNLAPKSVPADFDITKAFAAGTQPMFFSGPWIVGILNSTQPQLKGKWAIAPMPRQQAGTSFVGGSNFVVFKGSEHKDAVWKFVQFVSQPGTQVTWYQTVADLPASKQAWQQGPLADDPNLKVFRGQLDDAKAPPVTTGWDQLATKLNEWLQKLAFGKVTPQDAATGMQKDAEGIGS